VSPDAAKASVLRSATTVASLMVHLGDADGMLCGLHGRYDAHLEHIRNVIGLREGETALAALSGITFGERTVFIADTYVNEVPPAELLACIARQATREVRLFGMTPKVAFLSHSNYGSSRRESAERVRMAYELFVKQNPDVESDGEMHGDAALSEVIRRGMLMDGRLTGEANILVCPNIDAANILFNVLKAMNGEGTTVGPILMGVDRPAHVLTPSSTSRRILNMTALAAAQAGMMAAARRGLGVLRSAVGTA
jgi:malate dehydrogenase (oxaloacetate-decarboxylating)(NADP+)